MKYKVVLQHSDEGYSVSVPGLPGCWSQGKTEAEAIASVRDILRMIPRLIDRRPRPVHARRG